MEKWTAADEKLLAELETRRARLRDRWRIGLNDAMANVCYYDGIDVLLDDMIKHAAEISAALEPFVLSSEKSDE